MKNTKINVFIDMDGVLAEQRDNEYVRANMNNKHYFRNLAPIKSMVEFAQQIIATNKYNVYILSSVVPSSYCIVEKSLWLDEHLPEINLKKRLFLPNGFNKAEFAKLNIDTSNAVNVLIDDFNHNLVNWEIDGALPIKCLNQINNNKGTWVNAGGASINAFHKPEDNLDMVNNLIKEKIFEKSFSHKK